MFFFKQKTAYEMRISDWSSDVCSSDLVGPCADLRLALLDLLQAGFGQLDGAQRATCQPVALFDRLELQDGVHEASLVDHSGEPESDLGEVVEHRHGNEHHYQVRRAALKDIHELQIRWGDALQVVSGHRHWRRQERGLQDRKSTRLNSSHKCATR